MDVILNENFCRNLQEAMQVRGLTQSALGRIMEASPQFVNDYLHGRKSPGLDVVERFALALNLPGDWLIAAESVAGRLAAAAAPKSRRMQKVS